MTNEEINQETEQFVRQFRKEYQFLSGLFKKWRKRLRYREFKGKAKRGY